MQQPPLASSFPGVPMPTRFQSVPDVMHQQSPSPVPVVAPPMHRFHTTSEIPHAPSSDVAGRCSPCGPAFGTSPPPCLTVEMPPASVHPASRSNTPQRIPKRPVSQQYSSDSKRNWSVTKRSREPHNLVERRYRENLNGQLELLRGCLPSNTTSSKDSPQSSSDLEDGPSVGRAPSKAATIAGAREYIGQLREEVTLLREQVAGLQKLVRCEDCAIVNHLDSVQLRPEVAATGRWQ